jgi:hypothetical protein
MNKRRRFKAKRRRRVRVLAHRLWRAWADYTWYGLFGISGSRAFFRQRIGASFEAFQGDRR